MSDMAMAQLAKQLKAVLQPACERLEIAGSLRRGNPEPKDVELVAIPRMEHTLQKGLFGDESDTGAFNQLEMLIEYLATDDEGEWEFDPVTRRNGDRYKRLRHRAARNHAGNLICCDLFITNPAAWGAIFALRTGPAEFSHALVSLALQRGWFVEDGLLHQHRRLYKIVNSVETALPCSRGETCSLVKPTPEEADFFAALGVPSLQPAERTPARLRNLNAPL